MIFKKILNKKNSLIIAGIIILVIAAALPSLYFYKKYQDSKSDSSSKNSENEIEEILTKARTHILMPTDESPTIFTVTEKDKLSGQEFYKNAKNGDKVIVFYNAKKAFLYDPVKDFILEVGPVIASASATSPSPITKPQRFIILNGTTTVGLASNYEETLKKAYPEIEIVDIDNATDKTYEETVLIDLTNISANQASQLAQKLDIKVAQLPDSESDKNYKDQADFLIIVGSPNQ